MTDIRKECKKLKKGMRLDVTWNDAFSHGTQNWKSETDEAPISDMPMSAMGRFWALDEKYLMICGDMSLHKDVETLYSREILIPLGCIQEIQIWQDKGRKK